jgi:protein tyrosine phosphatase
MNIDIEMLIFLVENRPVLWDKTSESYKIKHLNFTAWMDICKMIHQSLELTKFNYR